MRVTIVGDWNLGSLRRTSAFFGTELRRLSAQFDPKGPDKTYTTSFLGFNGTIILHGDAPLAKPKEIGSKAAPDAPVSDGAGVAAVVPKAAPEGKTKVLRKG